MKIAHIASEIAPFSKSGGLADVVGALPGVAARAGHRVLTVSPRYGRIDPDALGFTELPFRPRVDVSWRTWRPRLFTRTEGTLVHVLVDHPILARDGLYGDANGAYGDNHVRFALLSRAGLEAVRHVPVPFADDRPAEPLGDGTVLHAHDWHAALVPVYLNALYKPLGLLTRCATVLTLHNLAHQGHITAEAFADLELPPRWLSGWALEWYGHACLLKGGIMQADGLTAVSPTYAREILADDGAFGLELPLRHRARDLVGILNGIDIDAWDPARDPHLPAAYDADDLEGKKACKASLQQITGLPVDPRVPLLASVGRLDPQKGVGWLIESIPWVVERHGAQVVVLGTAAPSHRHYETQLRALEARYPRHVRAWIGFSEAMAHRIEAGADLFVMPSVFEPCGLNQMYSLRYGTPPIVRAVGGLRDTVIPHNPDRDEGTGWMFWHPTGEALREAMHYALTTWRNHPAAFTRLVRRGMRQDLSWEARLPTYEAVYRAVLARWEPPEATGEED